MEKYGKKLKIFKKGIDKKQGSLYNNDNSY